MVNRYEKAPKFLIVIECLGFNVKYAQFTDVIPSVNWVLTFSVRHKIVI